MLNLRQILPVTRRNFTEILSRYKNNFVTSGHLNTQICGIMSNDGKFTSKLGNETNCVGNDTNCSKDPEKLSEVRSASKIMLRDNPHFREASTVTIQSKFAKETFVQDAAVSLDAGYSLKVVEVKLNGKFSSPEISRSSNFGLFGAIQNLSIMKDFIVGIDHQSPLLTQVRTITRNYWPRPQETKRIRKHGWKKRLSSEAGRKIIMKRILKGKYMLSH